MILRSYLISFTTPYIMIKHILKYAFLCLFFLSNAQKENPSSFIDVNMYSGNIARHNDNIAHLIQGHPNGFIIGWNKRVSGRKIWHSHVISSAIRFRFNIYTNLIKKTSSQAYVQFVFFIGKG